MASASAAALERIKNLYELIVILRILLMRDTDHESYQRILLMEDHLEERRRNHELWRHYETNVVQVLNEKCPSGFIERHTDHDIQRICGILDVNCFEIGQSPVKARALYPSAFLLAHDCRPNTTHTDDPATYELILRTSRRVRRHEAITLSYAYTLQVCMILNVSRFLFYSGMHGASMAIPQVPRWQTLRWRNGKAPFSIRVTNFDGMSFVGHLKTT